MNNKSYLCKTNQTANAKQKNTYNQLHSLRGTLPLWCRRKYAAVQLRRLDRKIPKGDPNQPCYGKLTYTISADIIPADADLCFL